MSGKSPQYISSTPLFLYHPASLLSDRQSLLDSSPGVVASTDMSRQTVPIKLTFLHPDEKLPVRHINLIEGDLVPIARASKSSSLNKDKPHNDNALIESPVISRSHAQLFVDKDKDVFIRDIGSMHGTRVNGAILNPHRASKLKNLDVISVGVDIKIDDVEHKQRTFQIEIRPTPSYVDLSSPPNSPALAHVEPSIHQHDSQIPPVHSNPITKAPNTFVVPDLDDDDDDDVDSHNSSSRLPSPIYIASDSTRSSVPRSDTSNGPPLEELSDTSSDIGSEMGIDFDEAEDFAQNPPSYRSASPSQGSSHSSEAQNEEEEEEEPQPDGQEDINLVHSAEEETTNNSGRANADAGNVWDPAISGDVLTPKEPISKPAFNPFLDTPDSNASNANPPGGNHNAVQPHDPNPAGSKSLPPISTFKQHDTASKHHPEYQFGHSRYPDNQFYQFWHTKTAPYNPPYSGTMDHSTVQPNLPGLPSPSTLLKPVQPACRSSGVSPLEYAYPRGNLPPRPQNATIPRFSPYAKWTPPVHEPHPFYPVHGLAAQGTSMTPQCASTIQKFHTGSSYPLQSPVFESAGVPNVTESCCEKLCVPETSEIDADDDDSDDSSNISEDILEPEDSQELSKGPVPDKIPARIPISSIVASPEETDQPTSGTKRKSAVIDESIEGHTTEPVLTDSEVAMPPSTTEKEDTTPPKDEEPPRKRVKFAADVDIFKGRNSFNSNSNANIVLKSAAKYTAVLAAGGVLAVGGLLALPSSVFT